jgi:hypothetical protein
VCGDVHVRDKLGNQPQRTAISACQLEAGAGFCRVHSHLVISTSSSQTNNEESHAPWMLA